MPGTPPVPATLRSIGRMGRLRWLTGRRTPNGHLPKTEAFDLAKQPWFPLMAAGGGLVIYVCIPALIATLLFRGGVVLLIAGVTFVQRDGARASRLRVFWRGLVAWSPLLLGLVLVGLLKAGFSRFAAALVASLLICGLAILSVAWPKRGLPDRLAGTWPVLH